MEMNHETLTQIIDNMYFNITKENMHNVFIKLKNTRNIEVDEIVDLLKFFVDTSYRNWPIKSILESLCSVFTFINWRNIYELVLDGNRKIGNVNCIKILIDCWTSIASSTTIPYDIFFSKAKIINSNTTVAFYRIVIDNSSENINLANNIFLTKLISKDEFKTKHKKTIEFDNNLNCVELFDGITHYKELVDIVKIQSSEYLILGILATINFEFFFIDSKLDENTEYLVQTTLNLLKNFFEGSTNQFIIHILLDKYKEKILLLLNKIDLNLTKTLDILLEHKCLQLVINTMVPFDFCFDIIILCSRRDHLNLEFFIVNNIRNIDQFIDYFYKKIIKTTKEKLFPFNQAIIHTILKALNNRKNIDQELSPTSSKKLEEIKTIAIDGIQINDKATLFLSEIIQSNIKLEDALEKFDKLMDEGDSIIGKNIFNLLIENYNSLYKLANSEMIGSFLGHLIKRKIGLSPFINIAIDLIKKSLLTNVSNREHAFAFKILELFYNTNPDNFVELEEIDDIKLELIKKDLIIIDDTPQTPYELIKLIENIVKIEIKINNFEKLKEHIKRELSLYNKIIYMSKNSPMIENISICNVYPIPIIIANILYNLQYNENIDLLYEFVVLKEDILYNKVLFYSFEILNKLEMFSISNEEIFAGNLGEFLGKLILARNKVILLDTFDANNYILKSIEYRRISVCIYFLTNFLKQGINGMIYVPNNPWLMSILEILNELYFYSLVKIRVLIKDLFDLLGIKLYYKETKQIQHNLGLYNYLSFNGLQTSEAFNTNFYIIKKVVSIAFDFSTRETASKLIKTTIETVNLIVDNSFQTIFCDQQVSKEQSFVLYKNLMINTLKMILSINTIDALKNSMYSNICHFFKLSLNIIPEDILFNLIADNVDICNDIIEKAAITLLEEQVECIYKKLINNKNESAMYSQKIVDFVANYIENEAGTCLNNQTIKFMKQLPLLSTPEFYEKKSLRKIENNEYQEIKSFLIQLGRKIPIKKTNFIFEEFPNILNEDKYINFKKVLYYLENKSTNKDDDCISLTKYLIGHVLKNNIEEDFVFEFLYQIFLISNKTKKETVNWLIYSEDESKNINLITKFIQYNFIFIEEYDQALAKFIMKDNTNEYLYFSLKLLKLLLLGEKVYCNIYNFIYTIEAISKKSDYNNECFEFLKEIEGCMMDFSINNEIQNNLFDELVTKLNFSTSVINFSKELKNFLKTDQFDFNSAMKSSWNHFVLYNGNYRFFKVDILAHLIKFLGIKYIYYSLEFLVQAYKRRMYLFNKFYCRFFIKWLDYINETPNEVQCYRSIILKILEIICPSNFPIFASQFIEIVNHEIFNSINDSETMWIAIEIMKTLKYNEKYEKLIYDYFNTREFFLKKYSSYLNGICPDYCINLKNFIGKYIKNDNEILIIEENCLKILTHYYAHNPSEKIIKAYEQLSKKYSKLVLDYEKKLFKISE